MKLKEIKNNATQYFIYVGKMHIATFKNRDFVMMHKFNGSLDVSYYDHTTANNEIMRIITIESKTTTKERG